MKNRRYSSLFAAAFLAALIIIGITGNAAADQKGTVRGGWLILRSQPSYEGKELSSYPTGTVVTITGKSGSWYAVTAPDGLTGYMLGSYLKVSGSGIAEGSRAWVTSRNGMNVRMRSGPGTQYTILAAYAPGTECTVLGDDGDFCKIQIGTLTGYMMAKYLTTNNKSGSSGTSDTWKAGDDAYVSSSNGKGVNLRSGPSKSYSSIGFYSVGTRGTMMVPGDTWSFIQIGGISGYMMTKYLKTTAPEPSSAATNGALVVSSNGKYVNLRTGPGLNYSAIYSYAPGTPVTVLSKGNGWYFVQIQKTYGYMMSQYIQEY